MTEFQNDLEAGHVERLLQGSIKQHVLIKLIKKNSILDDAALAHLLGVSTEKVTDVRNQEGFLDTEASKKLMDCFCLCCAN